MSSQLNGATASPPFASESDQSADLPRNYGVTRLVVIPRDPGCFYTYWEITPDTWAEVERIFGPGVKERGEAVLRFSAVKKRETWGSDVPVKIDDRCRYINRALGPGRFRAELGVSLPDGRFALLALSNEIWDSAGCMSRRLDDRRGALRGEWGRLLDFSVNGDLPAGSLGMVKAMIRRWESIHAVGSWSSGDGGSPLGSSLPGPYGFAEQGVDPLESVSPAGEIGGSGQIVVEKLS